MKIPHYWCNKLTTYVHELHKEDRLMHRLTNPVLSCVCTAMFESLADIRREDPWKVPRPHRAKKKTTDSGSARVLLGNKVLLEDYSNDAGRAP